MVEIDNSATSIRDGLPDVCKQRFPTTLILTIVAPFLLNIVMVLRFINICFLYWRKNIIISLITSILFRWAIPTGKFRFVGGAFPLNVAVVPHIYFLSI